jgi:peptide/nickel transport system substrate-binding protein
MLPGFTYGFVQFNLHAGASDAPHPVLGDAALRRALALATDRATLIRAVLGELGAPGLGPFVRAQFFADTTTEPVPFDRAAAARLLDSLGWRAGADSMRARNGRPLRLTARASTTNPIFQRMATILQEQWRAVGIDLRFETMDLAAFLATVVQRRDFDLVLTSITTTSSPASLPATWGAQSRGPQGRNIGRWRSAAFDARIDSALQSTDPARLRAQLASAFAEMSRELPALFLFETRSAIAIHQRFTTPPLRADAWWLDVPAWSVAADRRLPRDAVASAR